ncbi:MAG: hypothetical protein AB2A00_36725 [Myxococcota bacterium]
MNRNSRVLLSTCMLLLGALALPSVARAEQKRLPVVDKKLYPLSLSPEFGIMAETSLADRYTTHSGLRLSGVFHVFDMLAFEAHGGYLFGSESSIMETLRAKRQSKGKREVALPGLQQLTYHGGFDVQFSPIYGKLSFVSEFETTFHVYGIAGLGFAGTRTVTDATNDKGCPSGGIIPQTPSAGLAGCAQFYAGPAPVLGITGISPGGNDILGPGEYQILPLAIPAEYGLGLRLQGVPPPLKLLGLNLAIPNDIGRWFTLRLEIRNHHWLGINNQMNLNVVEDPEDDAACSYGYRLSNPPLDNTLNTFAAGTVVCYPNVHTVTTVRAGLAFIIPVNSFL